MSTEKTKPAPAAASTKKKKLGVKKLTIEDVGDIKAGSDCKTAHTDDACSFGSGDCDGKCTVAV